MSKLEEIKEIKAKYEAEVKVSGRAALVEEFKQFFDENPEIAAIQWRQCTPSFNDGDPCVFSMGDFNFSKVGDEEDFDWGHKTPVYAFEEKVRDAALFEAIFGDGYKITATREGFELEEYYE